MSTSERQSYSTIVMNKPLQNGLSEFVKVPTTYSRVSYVEGLRLILRKKIDTDTKADDSFDTNEDLIDLFSECDPVVNHLVLPPSLNELDLRNAERLGQILTSGLNDIRLRNGDIRLRIRLGYLDFPSTLWRHNHYFSYEKINHLITIPSQSSLAFCPYITKDSFLFDKLLTYFSSHDQHFAQKEETTFSILVDRWYYESSVAAAKKMANQQKPKYTTVFNVNFNKEGNLGSWNCLLNDDKEVASFNCLNVESNCDFAIQLEFGLRFPTHSNSTEAKFVEKLRLNAGNRLTLTVDKARFYPRKVAQKTKWTCRWKGYNVEISKDEIWIIHKITKIKMGVPIHLSGIDPHITAYKISLTKDSWENWFAENKLMDRGGVPGWNPNHFLPSYNENANQLLNDATVFNKMLDKIIIAPWNRKARNLERLL